MIILASASPRRKELLEQIGVQFEVCVSEAPEATKAETPIKLVLENAKLKAAKVAKIRPNSWVLGADTIVCLNDKIYGKPKDFGDAFRMLKDLSGKVHKVITGMALVKGDEILQKAVVTLVAFGEMTDEEILDYIAAGEPMDKAGAYAIQGIGAKYIKGIKGSYSNVVGLPLYELREMLDKIISETSNF